jgi:LemA protein
MSATQVAWLATFVILVFWGVGAYNRLVALRNAMARAIAPLESQIRQRHELLLRWCEALGPVLEPSTQWSDAVQAACAQLQGAAEALVAQPTSAPVAGSWRLAESVLVSARQRLQAELPAGHERLSGLETEVLAEQLTAADNTLAFARDQFNAAADHYNRAVRQFPTWVIARLFGFRLAGTL